ncbi:MAG: hypothetical protein HQM10_04850 [Candidatus Riflebacteria bacterium]|nr:hypothetical protein [Candidatus Riflebacteria bacterium]
MVIAIMQTTKDLPAQKAALEEKTKDRKAKRIYQTPELINLDVAKDTFNAGPTFLDSGAFS